MVALNRKGSKLLPMLMLFAVLLAALVLMSAATQNSEHFGRLYSWLLLLNAVGLLLLTALISHSLYRLLHRYRTRAPGARLTLRLAMMFVVISIAPVAVVYYFSLQFLQQGIDSWYDVQVDKGLEDALELSRAALSLRMREVLKQTERTGDELANIDDDLAVLSLGQMLNSTDATELTLFDQGGRIVATASTDPSVIVPSYPPEGILPHVYQGHTFVNLEPIRDTGFHIRAVVKVPSQNSRSEPLILQALFSVPDRLGLLADSVQESFDSYKEVIYLRGWLKASFILTLSLVLFVSVLAAIWTALYSSRRLVEPIRDLAEGTRAVAAGRYDSQLPLASNDELGFLVHSFNEMTRNLAQARDATQRSQQLLERQRAYLEAVLARLSSGVLTLDHDRCLRTYNTAATQILGADLKPFSGCEINTLSNQYEHLRHFCEIIAPHLMAAGDWRQELALFSSTGRRVLMCRGSSLPAPIGLKAGHVIVFDDITYLVQAERDAAWAEVARRLAHEIKNPLTPIQLSAERIRHKYLKDMTQDEGRILDRGTHTIIQQVHAMKDMVDAFNEYARPTRLRLAPVILNEFLTEVLYLYREYPAGVEIILDLDSRNPTIEADTGRLRQLLHNLVKNAIEAIQDGQGSTLRISTRCFHETNTETNTDYVELGFKDDGPGFPAEDIGDIFEPYVTTKLKGTGLGLAIVKKIVEEHGGVIRLESPPEGGANIIIRFPISTPAIEAQAHKTASITLSSTEEAG